MSPLQGTFGNVWRHLRLSQLGGDASYLWVEAKDAARHPAILRRHPAILRQPPTTKNYPAQNVMCEVEKPCSIQLITFKTLEKEND